MAHPLPEQEFGPAWWARFAERWNGFAAPIPLSSRVVLVLQVTDIAYIRCEFLEDGRCSLGAVQAKEEVPTFSGTVETWRSVLTGLLGVEKAVLAGHIDYVGPMSFLAENWDLLRSIVATGAQLVDTTAAEPVLTPTDVMIHVERTAEVIAVLREQLGMKVEAAESNWTGMVHPKTQQRVVIIDEPLPLGSTALGCRVKDLEAALAALSMSVPSDQLRVVRADGYAHILLYGSLSLLLYRSD